MHGSYLQGMETAISFYRLVLCITHGSYLQGMETLVTLSDDYWIEASTDPTYKEWKPQNPLY